MDDAKLTRPDPITVSVQDAVHMTGIGRSKLYEFINTGQLDTIVLGRRRFVKVSSLRALVGEAA